jgi:hypothetical protein
VAHAREMKTPNSVMPTNYTTAERRRTTDIAGLLVKACDLNMSCYNAQFIPAPLAANHFRPHIPSGVARCPVVVAWRSKWRAAFRISGPVRGCPERWVKILDE